MDGIAVAGHQPVQVLRPDNMFSSCGVEVWFRSEPEKTGRPKAVRRASKFKSAHPSGSRWRLSTFTPLKGTPTPTKLTSPQSGQGVAAVLRGGGGGTLIRCFFIDCRWETQLAAHRASASLLGLLIGRRSSFPRLEGSISFGRYVSESLDWGKWSSFRQNRYIEEAEKSSKPGSVAQMKAHFEARFKRIAAMKAAAQAEQASSTLAPGDREEEEAASMDPASVNPQPAQFQIEAAAGAMDPEPEAAFSPREQSSPATGRREEGCRMGKDEDQTAIREPSPKTLPPDGEIRTKGDGILVVAQSRAMNGDEENQGDSGVSDSAPRRSSQAMKPPLQESSAANREVPASGSKGKKQSRFISSKWPPLFGQALTASKENPSNQSGKRPSKDPVSKYPRIAKETPPPSAARTAPADEKNGESNPNLISPGRSDSPINLLKTPTRSPTSRIAPQSEARRTGTPSQPSSKKVNVVSQSVSTSCWKSSSSVWRRPAQVVCSPFRFRSDERAEKRREASPVTASQLLHIKFFFTLEEKLDAEKLESQSKAKEIAENELKKLRQGLGFKARPMPGFYRGTEPPKNEIKKVPATRPQSPKLGRRGDDPPEASPRSCFPSLRSASLARKCGSPSLGSGNKKKDKQLELGSNSSRSSPWKEK
ncbi:unnamed protein product [Spirodela intermedia]|uniref:TPX2 C-terminal domain-containing protein n=1 Tax=Spirodela intermedia TaxID=51605 RepID=A0A7I8JET3_SPIIN|nr:unnamed protein product [Spirodela intermedia]CAA6668265.1 unnamed protein product [Spirodela intermedia]